MVSDTDSEDLSSISDDINDTIDPDAELLNSEVEDEELYTKKEDLVIMDTKKVTNKKLYNIFKTNINNTPDSNQVLSKNYNDLKTKKDVAYFFNALELLNRKNIKENSLKYDYLYPHLDDELLSIKIYNKKEFNEHKYNVELDKISYDTLEEEANKLCNKDFELAPHQKFIKNFLSSYTPYNSIFLFHGLGTGKTCSAINIAEETRAYMKENAIDDIHKKILVICSQNIQENFKKQLFDPEKLEYINNRWFINNCAGMKFLDEINVLKQNISREKVIRIINNVINNYIAFMVI